MTSNRLSSPADRAPYVFFALFVFLCVFNMGNYGLTDWDELIYAESSRQMLVRGNYLEIFVNDQAFAEKPPFFFWVMTLTYRIFGVNEVGARMPSTLAAALLFIVLYRSGTRMRSKSFGLIWAVIASFSLFPTVLARGSVIDATFNMFIAFSCIGFFFFERALVEGNKREQWKFLALLSISMGLGVLAKGPLGGAVPVFSYGVYKLLNRGPMFSFPQFVFCSGLSLSIAGLWAFLNWLSYGDRFLVRFWEFQMKLFSTSLDGHEGPLLFHFGVVALGLLPWTPLLFFFPVKEVFSKSHSLRCFAFIASAWIGMVLLVMTLVQTKLPHYSSPVYAPLAFAAAYSLDRLFSGGAAFKAWGKVMLALSIFFPAALQFAVPSLLDEVASKNNLPVLEYDKEFYYAMGGFTLIFALAGFFFLLKKKCVPALLGICLSLVFMWNSLYQHVLPAYFNEGQRPLIEKVDEYKTQGDIVFYRALYFTPFFYNQAVVNVIGHYKFKGDPSVLSNPTERNQYVFTSTRQKERLESEFPSLRKIFENKLFAVYFKSAED